jgi:UDP-glucuronate 4-epimerase
MRILVTGSAGFVGFHLAQLLIAHGHEVSGIDGMTPYYDVRLKQARHARLAESDRFRAFTHMLEDADALAETIGAARPEVIVHLAAQAGVRYSLDHPRAYLDANVVGTFNLLEEAKKIAPRHFLMASTSSVYGANQKMPFEETDRTDHPMTIYAATKKATEDIAHTYAHLRGCPITVMRFFSVYGPFGRPDMALFQFTANALSGKPIDVYNHGRMRRDFTYVSDVCESVRRLIDLPPKQNEPVADFDSLSPVGPYRVVNVGGGNVVELSAFIEEIGKATGREIKQNMLGMQVGDVPMTFASPRLLNTLTGFTPKTPITQGVPEFVRWYRAYYGVS